MTTARCIFTRRPAPPAPVRRLQAADLFRTQHRAFRKNGLTYTDVFCGAGGSSIVLAEAGYELMLATNHDPRAIETHSSNFPSAEHVCADVNRYDMRLLPTTDLLWASPICTELSPSGRASRLSHVLRRHQGGRSAPVQGSDRRECPRGGCRAWPCSGTTARSSACRRRTSAVTATRTPRSGGTGCTSFIWTIFAQGCPIPG